VEEAAAASDPLSSAVATFTLGGLRPTGRAGPGLAPGCLHGLAVAVFQSLHARSDVAAATTVRARALPDGICFSDAAARVQARRDATQ